MSNELVTKFVFDERESNRRIDLTEKRLIDLNRSLNNFGQNPTFSRNLNSQFDALGKKVNQFESNLKKVSVPKLSNAGDDLFKKAQTDIRRAQAETLKSEKEITRNVVREAKLRADAQIREQRRASNDFLRSLNKKPPGGSGGGRGDFFGSGSALGLGGFGGLGAAVSIGGAAAAIGTAIDKSVEASRANRLLASSATEAGIAYDVLADKNIKAAQSFGLSNVAASQVTAKIQQLATFAGNPEQFDLLQTRFADLGAAKGIDSRDLNVLIGTILSGQDEGLNRLGISDPGQLYKAFAKEVGKTVEQLTQYEKVQAAVNAVVAKGAIFDGTATARMNSLEGATAKMNAQWENFTSGVSVAATSNLYFQNSLDLINSGLGAMSFNIDEVRRKLQKGFTPERIAREEQNGLGNQVLGGISSFGNVFAGLPFLAYDVATSDLSEEELDLAVEKYAGGIDPKRLRKILEAQRAGQIRAQSALDEQQKKDATSEKFKAQTRNLTDSYKARIDSFVNPASDGVEKARRSLGDLNKIQQDFNKEINKLGTLEKAVISEKIDTAARKFYTEDAKESVSDFLKDPDVPGARKNLEVLGGLKKYLSADTFNDLSDDLNKFLTDDLEKAEKKIEDLGKSFSDTFDKLSAKTNQNNPIAAVYLDAGKALDDLEEKTRGLSDNLRSMFADMQVKQNQLNLFEAKIDNNLAAFDLRSRAADFRKRTAAPEITDPKKFFDDYIEFFSKKLETAAGGAAQRFNASFTEDGKGFLGFSQTENNPFTRFNSNIFTDASGKSFTNGFSQSDARNDLLNSYDRVTNADGGFGGFSVRQKTFADLTADDKNKFFAATQTQKLDDSLNSRLQSQLSIINSNAFSPEQQAIADKKLIGLTSGLNPNEISRNLRESIALANEREADRREKYERDALQIQKDELAVQEQIAENGRRLLEIAEKQGLDGINKAVEILITNKSGGAADVRKETGKSADNADTRSYYEQFENQ